jgi:hypothetical protein
MTESPPPILPDDEAKEKLRAAIHDKLGVDWAERGWVLVTHHAYMARLSKGRVNVDFHVDYFTGEVTVNVDEVNAGQQAGSAFGWVLLVLFAIIALMLARSLGVV